MRLSQRGRVVDPVARHGDHAALGLEPLDDGALLLGQHLGLDLRDAELPGDRLGRRAAVARQHDDPYAGLAQQAKRLGS